MAKQKTHKGIAKRIKLTAKKKIKVAKAGAGHLMSSKNAKRRRRIRSDATVDSVFAGKIRRAMGHGGIM
jgi:large subunit ribosomal protein L35